MGSWNWNGYVYLPLGITTVSPSPAKYKKNIQFGLQYGRKNDKNLKSQIQYLFFSYSFTRFDYNFPLISLFNLNPFKFVIISKIISFN